MMQTTVLDDRDFDLSTPEVRQDVLVRHYDHEAVAWSPIRHTPIHLDSIAALVYQLLDGATSVGELVADVHEEVGVPTSIARNQIGRVVTQLDRAGLLTTSAPTEDTREELELFLGPPNP